jgi:hypothetical protein
VTVSDVIVVFGHLASGLIALSVIARADHRDEI